MDEILQTFHTQKTVGRTAKALGVSTRTVQRYLHANDVWPAGGRRPDLPLEDHLAIAQGHARDLPDLRRYDFTLRDVEGRAIPTRTLGAYTLKVSKRDPDYLHMMATLTNGVEVEIKTTFTHVKELLDEE